MEMLFFCLPKPGSFQPGWDNAVLEAKREAGAKPGNAGCRGTDWVQVLPQGSTLGPGCLRGDAQRNPWRGKGPRMELIYRVALPQSS